MTGAGHIASVLFAAMLAATMAAPTFAAERADIWDIPFERSAGDIDATLLFTDHACGSNGGPPGRQLAGFAEFDRCRPDGDGLYEVYFRYDDESEFMSRALEQSQELLATRGTTEFDFPVIASLLFDAAGQVRGKRLVSDPRPAYATARPRYEFWTLGNLLANHFSIAGWSCAEQPPVAGEHAVGTFVVKTNCTLDRDGLHYNLRQSYLQKRGQAFVNLSTGRYDAEAFESITRFEVLTAGAASGQAAR